MNTPAVVEPSLVTTLTQGVLAHFPPPFREAMTAALPELDLALSRLGLEVLDAERRGLRYCEAVTRMDFPLMGRVYNGAADILRWKVPAAIRKPLTTLLQLAADGAFDPTRKVLFAMASERARPDVALCRFLLWSAIVLNLRIHTWDIPQVETLGVLREMEDRAERTLQDLLHTPDMHEPDVRPLHVLVLGLLEHTRLLTDGLWTAAIEQLGAGLQELVIDAAALAKLRTLDARSAATLEPVFLDPSIGSQQIVDRHPQHFESVSAMESLRSRVRRDLEAGALESSDNRIIDLLRAKMGGK
jgi:hypothetical protein